MTKIAARDVGMDPDHETAFGELNRWTVLDDSAEARTFRLALNWHDNGVQGLATAIGGKASEDARQVLWGRVRPPEMHAYEVVQRYERVRHRWRSLVWGPGLLARVRRALVECTGQYVQSSGEISSRRLALAVKR